MRNAELNVVLLKPLQLLVVRSLRVAVIVASCILFAGEG